MKRLAFHALAYGGSAAAQKGLGFLLFMWLAQSLSVPAYATFGLLYALQAGVAALAGAGVSEAVIGLLKGRASHEARASLFGSANSVFLLVASATAAVAVVAGSRILGPADASGFALSSVIVAGVVTAFCAQQAQLVRLEEDHRASLVLSFFPPAAGLVGGFLGYLLGGSVSAFFLGSAVALTACLLVVGVARVGVYRFARSRSDIAPILQRLAPFVLVAVLGWLSGYGNTYLVQSNFDPIDVARFTFAYTISSVMQLVATSLNQVWSPRVFKLVHEATASEVESRSRRFFLLQGVFLGAVGALVLTITPIATRLGGEGMAAYVSLTDELFFLLAAYALAIPWYHAQNYYFAHSKGKALMNVTIVTSIAGLLLWFLAVHLFGTLGVYIGFMLMMVARSLGTLYWARRLWAVGLPWEGPAVALALLVAAMWLSRSASSFA